MRLILSSCVIGDTDDSDEEMDGSDSEENGAPYNGFKAIIDYHKSRSTTASRCANPVVFFQVSLTILCTANAMALRPSRFPRMNRWMSTRTLLPKKYPHLSLASTMTQISMVRFLAFRTLKAGSRSNRLAGLVLVDFPFLSITLVPSLLCSFLDSHLFSFCFCSHRTTCFCRIQLIHLSWTLLASLLHLSSTHRNFLVAPNLEPLISLYHRH
jgi:hypothetical protein